MSKFPKFPPPIPQRIQKPANTHVDEAEPTEYEQEEFHLYSLFQRVLPSEEFGEDGNVEELWDRVEGYRQLLNQWQSAMGELLKADHYEHFQTRFSESEWQAFTKLRNLYEQKFGAQNG